MKKGILIGTVTFEERDTIRFLFERRNALTELIKILPGLEKNEADFLYEKIVKDLGEVTSKYQDWWTKTSLKYNWENTSGKRWEINFETCEVFIQDADSKLSEL